MKISVGILCSVLGASMGFYLAIISLVTLPADGIARWFAFGGVISLSLIAGILINGISMQDYFKVSRAYNTLTARLSPLLYSGIEDVLQRRAATLNSSGDLKFSTALLTGDLLRSVASTYPLGHSMRSIERKIGEGVGGFFAKAKIAGFTQPSLSVNSANRPVFDRFGIQIGELPVAGRANSPEKWIYARPILESSKATPWSNRVVGMLLVHSSAHDADSLFKKEEFHNVIDSVATEVSPYLDAIHVLMGEENP